MKIRPILFSTPMVQAIINGTKTQTRRIIKPQPIEAAYGKMMYGDRELTMNSLKNHSKYQIGDIIWVRETWRLFGWDSSEGFVNIQYKDGSVKHFYPDVDGIDNWLSNKIDKIFDKGTLEVDPDDAEIFIFKEGKTIWDPSIFMPKWATRLFLECTNVRVERLQDISEMDAKDEGSFDNNCGINKITQHKSGFEDIWESINGKESWESNPWVWVYDFKLTKAPVNFLK